MFKKIKKFSVKTQVYIGIVICIFGMFLIFQNYIESKKSKVFESMNLELLESEMPEDITSTNEEIKNDESLEIPTEDNSIPSNETEKNIDVAKNEYYIGLLEIPKINLKKGFVDPSSIDNNINKNVTVISTSNYPNTEFGNFILAAHSGTGYLSFFRNLYKLNNGDLAYIYFNNKKYIYKIVDIYTEPKTGQLAIYRDYNETVLTLITCTKDDDTTQSIYIANLIEISDY